MFLNLGVAGSESRREFAENLRSSAQRGFENKRRRKISREAGRALEKLGHAIEYLADEMALELAAGEIESGEGVHPKIAAIEVLKACNREVYWDCPVAPTFAERIDGWLRRNIALQPMRPAKVAVVRRVRW